MEEIEVNYKEWVYKNKNDINNMKLIHWDREWEFYWFKKRYIIIFIKVILNLNESIFINWLKFMKNYIFKSRFSALYTHYSF